MLYSSDQISPPLDDKVTFIILSKGEFPHGTEEGPRCLQKEILGPMWGHPEGRNALWAGGGTPLLCLSNPPGHTSFSSPGGQADCAGCHQHVFIEGLANAGWLAHDSSSGLTHTL